MSISQKTHFNIGVVGFLDNQEEKDTAHVRVTSILSTITERVLLKEHEYNKTLQEGVQFDIYTSPILAGDFWIDFCQIWNMGVMCTVIPECSQAYVSDDSPHQCKTTVPSALSGIAQTHSISDWVTCQIDIAFALWNGKESANNGSTWMFIERCKQNGIPCIWIDTNDYEKSSWFTKIYPEPFNREALLNYIDGFYLKADDDVPEKPEEIQPHSYLFSNFWIRVSKAFEKRKNIQPVYDETKTLQENLKKEPVAFEDKLLHSGDNGHQLERFDIDEKDSLIIKENFEFLRNAFHDYENAADRISPTIRATLFCRTWVPLLSTTFLLIASYVETIMRFLSDKQAFMIAGWGPVDVWAFIAGIGFLVSAFLIFYNLKPNEPHRKNMKKYIVSRYVDEYLRVVLHFIPYGIPVSERILNSAIRNSDDTEKQRGAIRVRRLLRMRTPSNVIVNQESCTNTIQHLHEFFDSQISYQEIGRKQRFGNINTSILKWTKIFLWINLSTLALRAFIQFIAGTLPVMLPGGSPLNWIAYSKGGKNSIDFARSLANMSALMITALYDKYFRQKNMNHYDGYYKIANKILKELYSYKARIMEITVRHQRAETVSYDWLCSLAEDTVEGLIAELYWWCDETARG